MSEGTKIGEFKEDQDFNTAVRQESEESVLKPTKLGDVSEFEKSLYDEGEAEKSPEREAAKSEEVAPEAKSQKVVKTDKKSDLDFQQEMDMSMVDYMEGDIVKGVVRSIEKSGVLVDIKYKSDGFVSNSDFSNDPRIVPSEVLKPGDDIMVFIEKLESKEGYTILSRKKAEFEEAWNTLIEASKTKEPIQVHVDNKVQGGLVSSFKGVKGFIPASQVLNNEDDLSQFMNQYLEVNVIQVDRRRRKVIFSHKLAQTKTQRENMAHLLNELEVGDVRKGKVSSIKDFGVFVDIGGIEGLVHISELSWSRVNNPSDIVSVGDEVEVFVLGVDKENVRISLGMKQLEKDPWVTVTQKYQLGQVLKGKITRIVPFGAFMEIDEQLEGLIHISEISSEHIDKIENVLSVGDEVDAKIVKLLPEDQKIGLSIKAVKEPDTFVVEEVSTIADSGDVESSTETEEVVETTETEEPDKTEE